MRGSFEINTVTTATTIALNKEKRSHKTHMNGQEVYSHIKKTNTRYFAI